MNRDSSALRELQMLDHNLQNLLMQKQTFAHELNEVMNALQELEPATGDVYRVLGSVMMKADKKKLLAELEEKKSLLETRIKLIEKQEKVFEEKAEELRREQTSREEISDDKNED